MKNWRSTLGGALSAMGVFLFGAPIVINATSPDFPKPFMVWCMAIGFVLQGFGTFFAHWSGADAKALESLQTEVKNNTSAIISGDTTHIRKTPDHEGA